MKALYIGNFNYKGEIHTLYRHAHGEEQAKEYMIRALAKKLGVIPAPLRSYFYGRNNFHINGFSKEKNIIGIYSK